MKKGFTLVELLVVIAIISIITVIAVGQFRVAKQRANDVARKSDLNSLNKALQMYYADLNVFPASMDLTTGNEFNDGSYVYMKETPKEKFLANYPFCYKVDNVSNPKKFALFAMLENTADSDCKMVNGIGKYSCGGRNYCFAIVSPNTSLNDDGSFN